MLTLVPDLPDPASKPLPPKWDGHPIAWMPWAHALNTIICPPPNKNTRCPECGHDGPGWETKVNHHKTPHALRGLQAHRCPICLHDTVIDTHTWTVWDLDPLDYGPEGSRDWSTR